MTKKMLKLSPATLVAILFGVVAVFGGAYAYQSYGEGPKVVVEGNYIEAGSPAPVVQTLGANPEANPSMVCSASACTYTAVADFVDATTTIAFIPDPFLTRTTTGAGDVVLRDDGEDEWTGASTTVDLVRLDITGVATTTFVAGCNSGSSVIATSSVNILTSGSIATSTGLGTIENNLTAANGGIVDGGTVEKIALGHSYPYLVCRVQPVNSDAFTNAGNTFTGKITARFSRTR